MATLAVAFGFGPRGWRSELEFLVTDRHIVMRRGRLRRSIEIKAISFARIRTGIPKRPGGIGVTSSWFAPCRPARSGGDFLHRAQPRPRQRPIGSWKAIMRGVTPSAPAGDGERLLAQRLDDGERVLLVGAPVRCLARLASDPASARSARSSSRSPSASPRS